MSDWDVVIVGGGAAGLMAAASAAGLGQRTLLLEKNNKLGVKILMSGGTRCNITHHCDARGIVDAFGARRNSSANSANSGDVSQGQFLRSALGALPPEEVVRLIEAQGVPTKVESTGKIFPVSDRAIDVRDALVNFAVESGAKLRTGQGVELIRFASDQFEIKTDSDSLTARAAIVTTGGKSYPGCGTTGDGYAWAKSFGHSIVQPVPALTPIRTTVDWAKEIKGITIEDVAIRVMESATDSKSLRSARGSFLFTHFGFSGPAALNVSRAISKHERQNTLALECDFSPDEKFEKLQADLKQRFQTSGKQLMGGAFADLYPRRLADAFLETAGIDKQTKCAELSKARLQSLLRAIKQMRFPVSGVLGFKKAEVTAGGVALAEVNPRTMASNFQSGLYFAGEVLDIDGPIGGYNFQAAFSTGWLAGESAARNLNHD